LDTVEVVMAIEEVGSFQQCGKKAMLTPSRSLASKYPTKRQMLFTVVSRGEPFFVVGADEGSVDKAVEYILSQPDGIAAVNSLSCTY
jgi:hypothetical protein